MGITTKKSFRVCLSLLIMTKTLCAVDIISSEQLISINNQDIGEVYKGTEIIKNGSNFKIHGYVMSGNEYVVFYNNENKIKLAKLKNEFIDKYKILSEKQDSYGVNWKEVELEFSLKNSSQVILKKNDVWAQEEELYSRCGSCHKARTPEEYTVNQWPNVIKSMSQRAGFTADETRAVGAYMQYQALELHLETKK